MKFSILHAVSIALLLIPPDFEDGVRADAELNGTELLQDCQEAVRHIDGAEASPGAAACILYVTGYTDGLLCAALIKMLGPECRDLSPEETWKHGWSEIGAFCPPVNLSDQQVVRVLVKYLQDNPQQLHRPARILIMMSLVDAFPCR